MTKESLEHGKHSPYLDKIWDLFNIFIYEAGAEGVRADEAGAGSGCLTKSLKHEMQNSCGRLVDVE